MKNYNKKEYLKYVKRIKEIKRDDKIDMEPIAFKDWKGLQPIADNAVSSINKIIVKRRKVKNYKIELIYQKLKCGGLGYADMFIRYKGKYYLIDGFYSKKENLIKLYNMLDKTKYRNPKAFNTYLKRRNDNCMTAKKFFKVLKMEVK